MSEPTQRLDVHRDEIILLQSAQTGQHAVNRLGGVKVTIASRLYEMDHGGMRHIIDDDLRRKAVGTMPIQLTPNADGQQGCHNAEDVFAPMTAARL